MAVLASTVKFISDIMLGCQPSSIVFNGCLISELVEFSYVQLLSRIKTSFFYAEINIQTCNMQLPSSDSAFPPGSLVLVAGVSGFIASHTVEQLLLARYYVRGTVCDERKAIWTTELLAERHGTGKFSAAVVPDMSVLGAFDEEVKGFRSTF